MNIYTTDKIRNVVLLGHGGGWKDKSRGVHGISVRNHFAHGKSGRRQYSQRLWQGRAEEKDFH